MAPGVTCQKMGVAAPSRRPCLTARRAVHCTASANKGVQQTFEVAKQRLAAGAAAALLTFSSLSASLPAVANEFDVLTTARPTYNYIIDDADVLSKSVKKSISDRLKALETDTGYRVEVVTLRKLEFENDAFAFGDKLIERWYPTIEEGTTKGVLLVVTTAKDGALTGGPKFVGAVTDDLIDSIISSNIPVFTEEEKYNETVTSSVNRIEAVLRGEADPGGPERKENARKRTYKTKDETDRTRFVTTTVVVTLLLIAFVVPMLQFYGYTSKD